MATRRRLKSMSDTRRYLANLINRVEHGEVDPVVAGRLGFLTNILIRSIEASSLEDRVKKLEVNVGK